MIDKDGKESAESLAMMKAFGITITLEMKEDGTGYMETYGQKTEFTWDDKTIKGKDDDGTEQSMNYTYSDGKLTLEQEGEKMVFTKKELVKEDESGSGSVDLNNMFGGEEEENADADADADAGTQEE
jgi:hypothetical protein